MADHADWSISDPWLGADCDGHVALAGEKLPTGAVLCVIFVWFCLLGLLFLLIKERTISGYIQVTVQDNGFHHSTLIPATSADSVVSVHQMANYARALAALA